MHAKIKDGLVVQFPYGMSDMQTENPHTNYSGSFDVEEIFPTTEAATIHGYEVVPVTLLSPPEYDSRTQQIAFGVPTQSDGEWTVAWVATNKSAEQLAIDLETKKSEVRKERNNRLTASDWTQVADAPVDKQAWATYRQALRDITSQSGFPWDVTYPTAP
jgi:hypothetical protein